MHWCGIKFVEGPSGLWVPDRSAEQLTHRVIERDKNSTIASAIGATLNKLDALEEWMVNKIEADMLAKNPCHDFIGLRAMALEAPDPDAKHDPELERLMAVAQRAYETTINRYLDCYDPDCYDDSIMKDKFRFTDDVPGYDPGMPNESENYSEDQDAPRHSELTDSTLEDFL